MRLILGIGNPGKEYEATRHNCGFQVVDELARRHSLTSWQRKWHARVSEWLVPASLGGGKALLIKPATYVNASGEAAQAALAFHKLPPDALLVVVDDINLPLGTLRLRASGSAGGHNGLRNIEARLGQGYPRLRIGVGPPTSGAEQIDHVLSAFAPQERADAIAMIVKAADCCQEWVREGTGVACRYNGPLRGPGEESPRVSP